MPVMPLAIEKGPVIAALEEYLDTPANRITLLMELRDGKPLAECAVLSGNMDAQHHVRDHWGPDPGWMRNWRGDADAITRETLIRALEVACETPREVIAPDTHLVANHPIDFLITCGAEQFQGYVTWRASLTGRRVVVVLSAPGYGPGDYTYWLGIAPDGITPHQPTDPTGRITRQAVWVVGHVDGDRSDPAAFVSFGRVGTAVVTLDDGGY